MNNIKSEQYEFLRLRASQALSIAIISLLSFFVFGGVLEYTNSQAGGILDPVVSAGVSQLLFMFVPMLWMLRKYAFTRGEVLREPKGPQPMAWAYGLIGIVGIQIVNHGWNGAIPQLLPIEWAESWREMQAMYDSAIGQIIPDASFGTMVFAMLSLAIFPALIEEVLFRGVLQSSLERVGSPARAIVTTSVFFALAHAYPPNFPALFLMGLWLGFLAYYTQSLHLPVYLHLLNNGLAVVVMFSLGTDVSTEMLETGTLTEHSLLLMLGVLFLGLGVWGMQKHIQPARLDRKKYLPTELQD